MGWRRWFPQAGVRARAVAALLAASFETDDWALRLGLLDPRLAGATTGPARAAILREAAELSETRAENKATALAHTARALVADPDDRPTEALLVRLATETGGFRVAVHALEESAAVAGLTPRRATELLTHAAEVHEEQLGDAAAALNDYARALAAEPGRTDLRIAVVRCAGRSARWEPLAEALLSLDATPDLREQTLFPMAETAARANAAFVPLAAALGEIASSQSSLLPATLLALENRIAAWHEKERGDYLMAEAALARALGHCPDDLPTLHHLADIQRRSPAPSLYETLRRIAALATDDLDALYESTEWARDLALPDDTGLDAARALLDRAARISHYRRCRPRGQQAQRRRRGGAGGRRDRAPPVQRRHHARDPHRLRHLPARRRAAGRGRRAGAPIPPARRGAGGGAPRRPPGRDPCAGGDLRRGSDRGGRQRAAGGAVRRRRALRRAGRAAPRAAGARRAARRSAPAAPRAGARRRVDRGRERSREPADGEPRGGARPRPHDRRAHQRARLDPPQRPAGRRPRRRGREGREPEPARRKPPRCGAGSAASPRARSAIARAPSRRTSARRRW